MLSKGWSTVPLGKVVTLQRGFDLPSHRRRPGEVPIVTSSGIGGVHARAMVKGPGVVTGRYGTIGEVFFIERDFWPHNTTLFAQDFHGNDPLFISYLLRTIDYRSHSGKSGVPGVNRNDLHEEIVTVPPTLAEQQAIAEALSDVDALIDALERLIAKKRAIKQGAMQALLTGRRRLSGFDGEWEVTRFGDITQLRLDRVDPRRSGEVDFCVELENIEQGTGRLLSYADTDTGLSLKSVFQRDDVLFGKLRAYLRKFWLADRDGVCSTEIWVFKALRSRIIPTFLFQLVTMDEFIEVASTAYGTHMPRSDWKIVQNHEVRLPSLAEQTAIAAILSDMDAEIAALERRRDKTKLLKQGMMQELLTGRIRLV